MGVGEGVGVRAGTSASAFGDGDGSAIGLGLTSAVSAPAGSAGAWSPPLHAKNAAMPRSATATTMIAAIREPPCIGTTGSASLGRTPDSAGTSVTGPRGARLVIAVRSPSASSRAV